MHLITGTEFCRALHKRGWVTVRIRGSHHILNSPDGLKRVSVPVHVGESLKPGLLHALLKQTGLDKADL